MIFPTEQGVPIRIEIRPRDVKAEQLVMVRRDNGDRKKIKLADLEEEITSLLEVIHSDMYNRAKEELNENHAVTQSWTEFNALLDRNKIIQAPFCGDSTCEERIQKDSARDCDMDAGAPSMGAKSLCIPFKQPKKVTPDNICVHPDCSKPAQYYTLFGRSY